MKIAAFIWHWNLKLHLLVQKSLKKVKLLNSIKDQGWIWWDENLVQVYLRLKERKRCLFSLPYFFSASGDASLYHIVSIHVLRMTTACRVATGSTSTAPRMHFLPSTWTNANIVVVCAKRAANTTNWKRSRSWSRWTRMIYWRLFSIKRNRVNKENITGYWYVVCI